MKTLFLYLLLLTTSISFAQKDSLVVQYDTVAIQTKKFNKQQLKKYQQNDDFNYIEQPVKTSLIQQIISWFKRIVYRFLKWLFGVEKATGLVNIIFKVLPYIVLAIVLIILIKVFLHVELSGKNKHQTKKAFVAIHEDEDVIKNKDIQQLIAQALSQKEYRLAIRYYYLLSLQKLQENNCIEWEAQKTNEDYISELQNTKFVNDFKKLTHLYDYIWYGNFDINEINFKQTAIHFDQFNSTVIG